MPHTLHLILSKQAVILILAITMLLLKQLMLGSCLKAQNLVLLFMVDIIPDGSSFSSL
jgi:hypothetical protein